ncbi:MAG: hypothetical protein HYX48_02385 [Chlamydiales bacterium]|nr:hypothetical protein [Chlamydiales bacterium]
MVFMPDRSVFDDSDKTPYFLQAMDWTTEFVAPHGAQAIDKATGQPITEHRYRTGTSLELEFVQVPKMTGNIELDCLESMGRRVVGALCYAALAVAVEVELVVRTVLLLALTLLVTPCALCSGEFTRVMKETGGQLLLNGVYAIDAPIRALSGIVQKCLLNLQNDEGGKTYRELTLC